MSTKAKKSQATVPNPEPRLLTVKGAAAYLSTTVWAIRNLAWGQKVPYVRLGARILFDKADLDRFIESQKVQVAA